MCGIAGLLSLSSQFKISASCLANMTNSILHRGPDGSDFWLSDDSSVGLAHRRLSILDLTQAASQPMSSSCGKIIISFNGEIYNHRELRSWLSSSHSLRWITDHSDTEVILNLYLVYGIEFVKYLRGMFAISIWDSNSEELYLIRDRIGIKPIYYYQDSSLFAFASEIKSLHTVPEIPKIFNDHGVLDYLTFRVTLPPNTLFKGISKLASASWLRISSSGEQFLYKYWDVSDGYQDLNSVNRPSILEELQHLMSRSVSLHKSSDVPIGIFLSGGLDSTINAALFQQDNSLPFSSFCAGYEDSKKNEFIDASIASKAFQTNHSEVLLKEADIEFFVHQMSHYQDEPLGDPVCFPLYYLCKSAHDAGLKVVQCGEGADELFYGYPYWKQLLQLNSYYDVSQLLPINPLSKLLLNKRFSPSWLDSYRQRSLSGQPLFWTSFESFNPIQIFSLLNPAYKDKLSISPNYFPVSELYQQYLTKSPVHDPLKWMTYSDLNVRLPELLLMRVDKMSMAHSLECRVPFLDHKLVEFTYSIPSSFHISNGHKSILKSSYRDILPQRLLKKRKQGFSVPLYDWRNSPLFDEFNNKLKSFCLNTDILDWNSVELLTNSSRPDICWPLYNLALWWDLYFA